MIIRMSTDDWDALHDLMDAPGERAGFLFMRPAGGDVWEVEDRDLLHDQSNYTVGKELHLVLDDGVRPRVIGHAHQGGFAVAEVHGHYWPGDETEFSRYDLRGLQEFAPHMLWRLPARPYASIVLGRDGFDALVWSSRHDVSTLSGIEVGERLFKPTGLSMDQYRLLDSADG